MTTLGNIGYIPWITKGKFWSCLWSRRGTWKKNTERKIKILRSDNVGEYASDSFLQLCRNEGITRHFTLRKHCNKTGWLKGWTWPY